MNSLRVEDKDMLETIRKYKREDDYVLDPHSAVAYYGIAKGLN